MESTLMAIVINNSLFQKNLFEPRRREVREEDQELFFGFKTKGFKVFSRIAHRFLWCTRFQKLLWCIGAISPLREADLSDLNCIGEGTFHITKINQSGE